MKTIFALTIFAASLSAHASEGYTLKYGNGQFIADPKAVVASDLYLYCFTGNAFAAAADLHWLLRLDMQALAQDVIRYKGIADVCVDSTGSGFGNDVCNRYGKREVKGFLEACTQKEEPSNDDGTWR